MTPATRQAALGAAAIVALQFLWHAWLAPPVRGSGLLLATIAALPMLAALALFVARRPRAALVAGIFALLYFSHGVMEAWADRSVWPLGLAEAGLAAWIVFASGWDGLQARLAARRARAVPPL